MTFSTTRFPEPIRICVTTFQHDDILYWKASASQLNQGIHRSTVTFESRIIWQYCEILPFLLLYSILAVQTLQLAIQVLLLSFDSPEFEATPYILECGSSTPSGQIVED